ncbi:MAG: aldose 1-epimerase [Bacteroidota bacterium]
MTILQLHNQKVTIDQGELVGYVVDGHEYIHQKGSPGWRSSDTEMFPIIGPTAEADFKVWTPKGNAILDQHGLLREMPYVLKLSSSTTAIFQKAYKAGTKVRNSKYPKKSTEKELHWPYDFRFQKRFHLTREGLEIVFTISGEEGMPFMLGYHPAFKLHSGTPYIQANNTNIALSEVLAVGSRALQVANCTRITLKDKRELHLEAKGFGGFMLWTEVPNMICLEPITFYPYAVDQKDLNEGFQVLSKEEMEFGVLIRAL